MLHVTRSGPVITATAADLEGLRTEFDRAHCIRLPAFLTADLVRFVQDRIERASFDVRIHTNISRELCLADDASVSLLHFLMNDPRLFECVRRITGCDRIGCFTGRIYRMVPGSGHYDSWHSDRIEHRMVGLSLNLSARRYEGGVFSLREADSGRVCCEAVNTGSGDAILFRIADGLQHQVTPVEGSAPKTAFAGWFQSQPEFLSLLSGNEMPARGDVADE